LRWTRGGRPARQPVIRLHLHNVRSLTVLLRGAGFRHGQRGKLRIRTDGRTRVNLRRSSGHDRVLHLTKGSRPLQFTA
jgi:hypothetical protein